MAQVGEQQSSLDGSSHSSGNSLATTGNDDTFGVCLGDGRTDRYFEPETNSQENVSKEAVEVAGEVVEPNLNASLHGQGKKARGPSWADYEPDEDEVAAGSESAECSAVGTLAEKAADGQSFS